MAINVGPNLAKPTHHVKLTKDSQSLGLILCNALGKQQEVVDRSPFPASAVKTYQGEQKHSDSEPPYLNLVQQDWSIGRGQEVLEDNKSRYQDGKNADTILANKIILGPQPTYSTGIRTWQGHMPGKVVFYGLYGSNRYLARRLTASSGWDADAAEILVRKVGTPNDGITVMLMNEPRTVTLKTISFDSNEITTDLLSVWLNANWYSQETLIASTNYYVVVKAKSGSDDANNHWEIGCEPYEGTSLNSFRSSDGSSWTSISTSYGIYYRVVDVEDPFTAIFAEYRDQLYIGTKPEDNSAGALYRNGDRGACDSNSGDKSKLYDSTKTGWTTQPGEIAKIICGNPAREDQNWRDIVGSGNGFVTCYPNWKIVHSTNAEYVILGSDAWTKITDPSSFFRGVSDIAVANDIMYIAQSRHGRLIHHREESSNGVFYDENGTLECWRFGGPRADHMQVILDYISGPVIWFGRNDVQNDGDAFIIRDLAPTAWSENPTGWLHIWDTDSEWDEQSIGNVTRGFEGKTSALYVADAFTTGVIGSKAISSTDIRYTTKLRIHLWTSIDLASGVLEFVFDDTANCASPIISCAFPALKKYTPKWYVIDYDASAVSGANAVISIGLRLTQDVGAVAVYTKGHVICTKEKGNPIVLGDKRLNGLERYGEPENLWVFTEGELGEIRNNYYQPVPLRELNSVKDSSNGRAHLVHDVYLYMSLKEGLERYYRQHMDDIGPNRDMGLPNERRGVISHLVGYPGRIYAAIDAGSDGYSSVLCYNKGGWHEIYRSRFKGRSIRRLHIQSMPGKSQSRLWISEGSDVLWIPIALNPLQESDYRYIHESAVITSRIYGGMQDLLKYFHSVKLATRGLTSGLQVYVDYRTDEQTSWTRITTPYTTSPYQENDLVSTYNVEGRYIELRIVLQTEDNTVTPEVLAYVIKSVMREESKYASTYSFRVKDWDRDLQGDPIDETISTIMSKLNTMISTPAPIYVNSISDLEDGKWMVPQPASLRRLEVIEDEDGRELHICQVTMLEM